MSVSTLNVFNQYVAGGGTDFSFTFYCRSVDWLVVKVDDVPTTAFTTVFNSNDQSIPGGVISFLVAPANGAIVRVERDTPRTQPDVYSPQGPFPAQTVEYDFDRAVCVMQELAYLISLITIPSVIGNALKFLQVKGDESGMQWADVLPKPYIAGRFLGATSPTDLAWLAGGGGGGGVVLGPFSNTPTAEGLLLDGVDGNVLHATAADDTHGGSVSTIKQKYAGQKIFVNGAVVSVFDIRQFDDTLVPNDPTKDMSVAWYRAVQYIQTVVFPPPLFNYQNFGRTGAAIYIPTGWWYTSKPLLTPWYTIIYGDGNDATNVVAGASTSATPANVEQFSGPVFYATGEVASADLAAYVASVVTFDPPLNGTSTHSLHLSPTMLTLPLHDSYPWTWFLGMMIDTTAIGVRFEYKLPSIPTSGERHLFGTEGPTGVYSSSFIDRALCFKLVSDGVNAHLRAYFTTCPDWTTGTLDLTTGQQTVLDSGNLTVGVTANVELNYDGTNVWLYINGVHQMHVGTTGPVFRQPWESATIGNPGMEIQQDDVGVNMPPASSLGCIEMAKTPFHTGTGSFTPTPGPYTASANTVWLCNWDQTNFPLDPAGYKYLPFIVAQAAVQVPGANNGPSSNPTDGLHLVPHYIRMKGGTGLSYMMLQDLHIHAQTACTNFSSWANAQSLISRVSASFGCRAGFQGSDGNGFYSTIQDCNVFAPSDIGILWFGDSYRNFVLGAPIGIQVPFGGRIHQLHNQPNFTNFICTLLGPGTSKQSLYVLDDTDNDAEGWAFLREQAIIGILSVNGSVVGRSNIIQANSSNAPPIVMYGFQTGQYVFEGDSWQPGIPGNGGFGGSTFDGSPCQFVHWNQPTIPESSSVMIINPTGTWGQFSGIPYIENLPYSNLEGGVTLVQPGRNSQMHSVSTTDVLGSNLIGTFTIQHGFTWGRLNFFNPEPDANYKVWVQPLSYTSPLSNTPAAGSLGPGLVTQDTDGFFYDTGVDPGTDVVITFGAFFVRCSPGPFYSELTPAVPSTLANPLIPDFTDFTPWAIGFTLRPVGGDVFVMDGSVGQETMLNLGTTPNDSHWTELYFTAGGSDMGATVTGTPGGSFPVNLDPTQLLVDASNPRNKLLSLYSPGAHNFAIAVLSPNIGQLWIDGGLAIVFAGLSPNWTNFLSTIYRGRRFDASFPLTGRATMHDFKIDFNVQNVITLEQDIGPGRQTKNAFMGDEWTVGRGSTSASGGYASQCAQLKYGTDYYYMAASTSRISLFPGFGFEGYVAAIWQSWGQYQSFTSAVVNLGWHDLLNDAGTPPTTGRTGAATFVELQKILEGAQATQTFTPPTTNSYAIALFGTNQLTWGGGITLTIAGVTFPVTFTTNQTVSFTNLCNAINSDPTVGPLGQATHAIQPSGQELLTFTATAPGTGGNGIPFTTVGGATFTGFPSANATFAGVDCVLNINNVSFPGNFVTSAAVTCNNYVNAINASIDPAINGIVTASNVANKVVITADTAGLDGNDIPTVTNGTGGAFLAGGPSDPLGNSLKGGLNGLLNRCPNIFLTTVPPFGVANAYYTAGKETQRQAYNTAIRNWVIANAGAGAVLFDLDLTVKDGPGTSLNAAYDNGSGYLNDAGQTAAYGVISALLP